MEKLKIIPIAKRAILPWKSELIAGIIGSVLFFALTIFCFVLFFIDIVPIYPGLVFLMGLVPIVLVTVFHPKYMVDNNKSFKYTICLREDNKLIIYHIGDKKDYIDLNDIIKFSVNPKRLVAGGVNYIYAAALSYGTIIIKYYKEDGIKKIAKVKVKNVENCNEILVKLRNLSNCNAIEEQLYDE